MQAVWHILEQQLLNWLIQAISVSFLEPVLPKRFSLYNLCATPEKNPYAICEYAGWLGSSLSANRINGCCSIWQRTENVQIRLHSHLYLRCYMFHNDSSYPRVSNRYNIKVKGNLLSPVHVPRVTCSVLYMFQGKFALSCICSKGNLLCSVYVPRVICSVLYMFKDNLLCPVHVPRVTCSVLYRFQG